MKAKYLHELPAISKGLEYFLLNDSVFKQLRPDISNFTWPYYGPGFSSLCRIICSQQVSTRAAQAIWERFYTKLETISPDKVLNTPCEELRAVGLSQQKVGYVLGVAHTINSGQLDLGSFDKLPDQEIFKKLTSLKGFGPWSAEIYLMFCLGRPDIWPAGDLGIQYGLQHYLGSENKPDESSTRKSKTVFTPYATAASLLMWHIKSTIK